ncbi:hypothetical protein IF655_12245 [Streptomyces sp. DSM 110735]|uniref:hypothetical protein n=1 Tax=Streptomyces sp. DSM 110735 TaxID=2775031 RepID=UPI0018F79477|nr:hypothetical protein [Streptomyces sp. DSM 110735]MBJ7904068.1 hypothetical protein [Streptomyces sp. DSM 110735]
MDSSRPVSPALVPRLSGAAVTGAGLAAGATAYLARARERAEGICGADGVMCVTWGNLTALPVVIVTALVVLVVVYKRLDIRPRLAVIPPTLLLAPLPLTAAQTVLGGTATAAAGAVWAGALALTAWDRYRVLGLTAGAVLVCGSIFVLYG